MTAGGIEAGAIVHVAAVLGKDEWTDKDAFVRAVVSKGRHVYLRLRMWPCGWSPKVSTVATIRADAVTLVALPVPSGEVRRG